MKTDLNKVLDGIDSKLLNESVKTEINTLFEVAVNEKANEKMKELDEKFERYKEKRGKELEAKQTKYIEENLVPDLTDFAESVSEEFVKENEMAIDNGIKAKCYDKLVNEMRDVFTNNYVQIDEKAGVKNIESKLDETKKRENRALKENIELQKELAIAKAGIVFEKKTADLSVDEKNEVTKLVKDFSCDDVDKFAEKIDVVINRIIRENKDAENTSENKLDEKVNDSNFRSNKKTDDTKDKESFVNQFKM